MTNHYHNAYTFESNQLVYRTQEKYVNNRRELWIEMNAYVLSWIYFIDFDKVPVTLQVRFYRFPRLIYWLTENKTDPNTLKKC